jgi:ketosteroid isomerase-like protein
MSSVLTEIAALEEQLRLAELSSDATFFETVLADDVVVVAERGESSLDKSKIVEAHQPGRGVTFTRVEMHDVAIQDHGDAAVVTCRGTYEGPGATHTLRFMRVWFKKRDRWQIIAASILA